MGLILFLLFMAFCIRYTPSVDDRYWFYYLCIMVILLKMGLRINIFGTAASILIYKVFKDFCLAGRR